MREDGLIVFRRSIDMETSLIFFRYSISMENQRMLRLSAHAERDPKDSGQSYYSQSLS